jgi:hypothetical protein
MYAWLHSGKMIQINELGRILLPYSQKFMGSRQRPPDSKGVQIMISNETAGILATPGPAELQKMAFATARLQAHAFTSILRFQIEALMFLRRRLEQDMRLAESLARSSDFSDAFDMFAQFAQNAATEYSDESGRMAEITAKVASDAARKVRRETRGAIEDLAASTVA